VDAMVGDGKLSGRQAELMRKWAGLRDWRNWDDDDESREFGRRLSVLSDWRRSLLGVERTVIVSMRNKGELTEEVLKEMQHDLDLEEALLERRSDAVDGHLAELPNEQYADNTADAPHGDRTRDPARDPARDPTGDRGAAPADSADDAAWADSAAAIDDADVSALLGDEQSADSRTFGQRATGPGGSPR